MSDDEIAVDALLRDPLPPGFRRRVLRVGPGLELDLGACDLPDALVLVEAGEAELVCPEGVRRRFGRGSMIPLARLRLAHVRSVGAAALVLVEVSRAPILGTDEFLDGPGSYVDC